MSKAYLMTTAMKKLGFDGRPAPTSMARFPCECRDGGRRLMDQCQGNWIRCQKRLDALNEWKKLRETIESPRPKKGTSCLRSTFT